MGLKGLEKFRLGDIKTPVLTQVSVPVQDIFDRFSLTTTYNGGLLVDGYACTFTPRFSGININNESCFVEYDNSLYIAGYVKQNAATLYMSCLLKLTFISDDPIDVISNSKFVTEAITFPEMGWASNFYGAYPCLKGDTLLVVSAGKDGVTNKVMCYEYNLLTKNVDKKVNLGTDLKAVHSIAYHEGLDRIFICNSSCDLYILTSNLVQESYISGWSSTYVRVFNKEGFKDVFVANQAYNVSIGSQAGLNNGLYRITNIAGEVELVNVYVGQTNSYDFELNSFPDKTCALFMHQVHSSTDNHKVHSFKGNLDDNGYIVLPLTRGNSLSLGTYNGIHVVRSFKYNKKKDLLSIRLTIQTDTYESGVYNIKYEKDTGYIYLGNKLPDMLLYIDHVYKDIIISGSSLVYNYYSF